MGVSKSDFFISIVILLIFVAGAFLIMNNQHQFAYKITNARGYIIYCDDFTMNDSSVTVTMSNGTVIQMDSVINVESIN